jgi:hypothetical protein
MLSEVSRLISTLKPNLLLFRMELCYIKGAYEYRLEKLLMDLLGNPYNSRKTRENPHQQAPVTALGS